jgi:ParB family chromosome partitioning protein
MSTTKPNQSDIRAFQNGHRVVDGEQDPENQDEIIVINQPKIPINNWYGSNDVLVAHSNPDYPETDNAVVTVYRDEFEEKYGATYTGSLPLQIRDAHRQDFQTYSFPESRLEPVAPPEPLTIPLEKILPSPYHVRQFTIGENEELIREIESLGRVFGTILTRPKEDSPFFELMNGHKRIWAATIAEGIETVDIEIHPSTNLWAARKFARFHLEHPEKNTGAYTGSLREKSIERMNHNLDNSAQAVFEVIEGVDPQEPTDTQPLDAFAE